MATSTTPRLGATRWSENSDPWPARPGWDAFVALLESVVALDGQDVIASRPAAGVRGRYFYATDQDRHYRDTGSAWKEIGAVGGAAPESLPFGGSGAEGTSARAARADHVHPLPEIPNLPASIITSGTFDAARIPSLDGNKIGSGTIDAARIPSLDAAKIGSGTIDAARIPSLPASIITSGTFDAARIPSLDAAKITSGTLGTARIPDLDAAKIASGVLSTSRIPALSAAWIQSGQLDSARVPFLIGELKPWLGETIPAKHLLLNGQTVSRSTYSELFSLWGTTFGAGDGSTTFKLPDLRNRGVFGAATTSGWGVLSGSATATLTAANLPPHAHAIDHDHASFNTASGGFHNHDFYMNNVDGAVNPVGRFGAFSGATIASNIVSGGGGHAHAIDVPPYTGNSGDGPGSSTPISIQPPQISVNWIVRALP